MQPKSASPLFFIFAVSGFSGLIYESIWTHYLKLFLGHSAYAQTLVLAIFMGGMAVGSWVCSRYSLRWKNLLVGYALAEGVIGLLALLFHTAFDQAVQFSYASVIPHLGSAASAYAYKWILSALLILPQSVLLGMTFPLMTAGIMRLWPRNPGRTISLLYFTNSLGAALGVLVSGFVLIRLIGLPWTIRAAGLVNIALALSVWLLARGQQAGPPAAHVEDRRQAEPAGRSSYAIFLWAALITGAASFIYEITWIRMLNLVMGASTHAFELMLSAFILGLALGGLWIQRRIDGIPSPARFLAFVQVTMGLLALCTLPLYGQTFNVMRWLLKSLGKTEGGYFLFNLSSNAIALAVMLPTTICAGMTLPLITYALLRRGHGERSIGAVYAANTVGAILGVFFAIHVGMTLLGLKGLITFGAGCDIALGVLLLWFASGYASKRVPAMITVAGMCAVAASAILPDLDSYRMASGVYRDGMLLHPQLSELAFHKDGKTATISVYKEKQAGGVTIATNGKPDASLRLTAGSQPTTDEATMVLLGVLPMAYNPAARTVANIGFGSGLTTHTLLGNPRLERVDTVEIEEVVLKAEQYFRPRVDRAYDDPRSRIFIDDAKTYFSVNNKKYDVIVSEPSNPWVSGVAGLFSEEFYRQAKQHLNPDGVFAQWVQLYEIDTDLVLSILKAVSDNFPDFAIYASNDQDMIIIAKNQGTLPGIDTQVLGNPELSAATDRVGIRGLQDIEARKIGNKRLFERLLAASGVDANSDYYPVVDQNAARTRFLRANAFEIRELSELPLPALEMLTGSHPSWNATDVALSRLFSKSQDVRTATMLRDYSLFGHFNPEHGTVPADIQQLALQFGQMFLACRPETNQSGRQIALYNVLIRMAPYLRPQEMEAVWNRLESVPCARSLTLPERNWIALFKSISRRDAGAMVSGARAVLESGERMPAEVVKFVVASSMLGSLTLGDRHGASRLWSAYGPLLFKDGQPSLLYRILIAESTHADRK
jgi:spermidine synthase